MRATSRRSVALASRVPSNWMSGFWAVFWLAIILKIPIAALLYIVWWAVREPPVPEADPEDGSGGSPRDPHPRIRPPQPPRRGPHADPAPASPGRVRVAHRRPRVPER
jgi:hypothetical protein